MVRNRNARHFERKPEMLIFFIFIIKVPLHKDMDQGTQKRKYHVIFIHIRISV